MLGALCAVWLTLVFVLVMNSFRSLPDIQRSGLIRWPHSFSLTHWQAA